MPIYWVECCFLQQGKREEYEKWLNSTEAQQIFRQIENDSGVRYLNACFILYGLYGPSEYHCEDWWVAPNWASVDRWEQSKAVGEWHQKIWKEFRDPSKTYTARVMEAAWDFQSTHKGP